MKFTKKILAIILVIVIFMSFTVNVFAATGSINTDVSENAFDYEEHVAKAQRKQFNLLSFTENSQLIGNDYIEFMVEKYSDGDEGKFTIGNVAGNPNFTSDDYKILMFGHSSPWSSFTTIRINDINYIFNTNDVKYDPETLESIAVMDIDGVIITQHLKIVENSGTGLEDTVKISYTAQNTTGSAKSIGIRIMLDTMLGHNDGAPFKVPSVGNVIKEIELVGNAIPAYWQAFDDLDEPTVFSVGTFYTATDRKPDKVQFTNWGNVYNTPWDYNINPNGYVTGDSAVSIYWDSKRIAAGADTTVSTYYGVGYSDTGSGFGGVSEDISSDGFGIMVVGEDSQPIPDATVKATNIEGQPTVVTNDEGVAIFDVLPDGDSNERTVNVEVSKDGYFSSGVLERVVNKGGFNSVVLVANDGKSHITSAIGSIDDNTYDLLNKNKFFKSNADDAVAAEDQSNVKHFRIDVSSVGAQPIEKYQLIQGGEIVFESTSSTITIPVLTGTPQDPDKYGSDWRITELHEGEVVYLRAVDVTGNTSERKALGIKISEPTLFGMEDTKGNLNFGEKLKINIPSEVPLLGDTEIELGWNGLPFEFDINEDGKVKFAINPKRDVTTGKIDWNNVGSDYEEALQSAVSDRVNAAKAFGGKPVDFGAGCLKVEADVMGYGEGYITDLGTFALEVGLVITVQQEGTYTWTYFLGYVPVYIAVGEKVSLSGKGSLTISAEDGNIDITGAVGEINPKITLNVDGGVGANNVLNIGVSGRATLSWLNRWSDNYNNVSLTGEAYIVATAFLFKAEKKLASGTWTIYDSYDRSRSLTSAINEDFYNSNSYKSISRDYLYAPSPMWLDYNEVAANIYPDAAPTLVHIGERAYLFWLSDIPTRADNDRTALVYAMTEDFETWSIPKQIIAESSTSTADFSYDVLVDGTDIHIALSKANSKFGEVECSLDEMGATSDIYYTKLDTDSNTVSEIQRLTNNMYADVLPTLAINDNEVMVAYVQNKMESGVFGVDNSFNVCYQIIGEESVKTKAVDGLVTSLSAGLVDDKLTIGYVLDTDRNYNTSADTQLWTLTKTSDSRLSSGTTGVASPTFAEIDGEDVIMWYEDQNIHYLDNINGTAESVFDGKAPSTLGQSFYVIEGNGGTKILWQAMDEDETYENTLVYATSYEGDTWSEDYILFDTQSELSSVLSGYWDGQTDRIAFLKTSGIEHDMQTTTLCVESVEPSTDLKLSNVAYDIGDIVPGQQFEATLTIQNKGATTVNSIEVDGGVLGSVIISNMNLKCGEEKTITVDSFVAPDSITSVQEFDIFINAADDHNYTNNEYTIELGYTDISVQTNRMFINGNDWLNITVANASGIPANTTLRVISDEEDGAVLYEEKLQNTTNTESKSVLLNLAEISAGTNIKTFHIVASEANGELTTLNNKDIVYVGLGQKTLYSLSVVAGTGGTLVDNVSGLYAAGKQIELEAIANEGYEFVKWYSPDGGVFENEYETKTTFTMPENNTVVTAIFQELETEHAHDFVYYEEYSSATCQSNATQIAKCEYCEAVNIVEVEGTALGHDFSNWYVIKESSLTQVGVERRDCLRCGFFELRNVTEQNPTTGWKLYKSKWYYFKNGELAIGWVNVGGTWYYMSSSGAMVTGWICIGGNWYYMNSSGAMATGWICSGGTWYYMNSSGAMATGWVNDGGTWYYMNSSGAMATGWVNDGGTWYYMNSSGTMATGWVCDGGAWYYMNSSGAMATGWVCDGGAWYYMTASGEMATGWILDNGQWYFLNESGMWVQ